MSNKQIEWCSVPVIVDDTTADLFHMEPPNQDADQKPEFRVTQATMDLVPGDFERYKPSLQRMVDQWLEEKEREMAKGKTVSKTQAA